MSARWLALLLLTVLAACGKVGDLALPAGTPIPDLGTDVIFADNEF